MKREITWCVSEPKERMCEATKQKVRNCGCLGLIIMIGERVRGNILSGDKLAFDDWHWHRGRERERE